MIEQPETSPAMIEAGAQVIFDNLEEQSRRWSRHVAKEVFVAMMEVYAKEHPLSLTPAEQAI
jgi:hypothetical protein